MPAAIQVGKDLQAMIRQLEKQAPGAVYDALDNSLIPLVNEARAAWPKKSGYSAQALRLSAERRGGQIARIISNPMPYAGQIEFKGTDTNVAVALIFDPVAALLDTILKDIGEGLTRG